MATNMAIISGGCASGDARDASALALNVPRAGVSRVRRAKLVAGLFATLFCLPSLLACEEGGVGDPCIPEDEFDPNFPGFSKDEINIESRSFQCRTRVCLVANFQGRVSCKYGQLPGENRCKIPDLTEDVELPVLPQLKSRRPEDAVYCSYRCKAPQANAPVQECPDGFECREMLGDIGLGDKQLAGHYCIKNNTYVEDPSLLDETNTCNAASEDCGDPNEFY